MAATEYVVYRHGSNGANQPMTPVMAVGIYTGEGRTARERRADACEQAERDHTVYSNQYLTARPSAHVLAEEVEAASENQFLAHA